VSRPPPAQRAAVGDGAGAPSAGPAGDGAEPRDAEGAGQRLRGRQAAELARDLDWLAALIAWRFRRHFTPDDPLAAQPPPEPPALGESDTPYAAWLRARGAGPPGRAAVLLALAPLLRPQALDLFFTRNRTHDKPFAEFGGQHDAAGAFHPSGQTLAFLVAGDELAPRLDLLAALDPGGALDRLGVLQPPAGDGDAPPLQGLLRLPPDALGRLTTGRPRLPAGAGALPARPLHTALDWDDLVLHPGTLAQVREVEVWLRHRDALLQGWGMAKRLRPGLRVLFHGPPGTGKSMTAALLGQGAGRAVWQVDLSQVVSKYIGETEKNLARVFDAAQQQGWMLFFDEADALFGRRSETRDAHDRYANQEVAYLLQRIETFDGIAILASNLKDHLDPAFARRFESVVYFPMPRAEERLRLWRQSLPAAARLAPDVDLAALAARHELGGGAILNAVRHACLHALDEGGGVVTLAGLQRGIRRELAKDGREA